MNGALTIVALVGLIIALIGRWMVGAEARNISLGWLWAIRCLPLAELMFLARYWEVARTGALTSLVGLALILPWGAKTMWDVDHKSKQPGNLLRVLDGDQKNSIFMSIQSEHEDRIEREQQRLQKLNARMAGWFSDMQARRAKLTTPEEITAFNEEAAAYKALHAITREEVARIAELQATRIDSWSQITEEMAREHLFGGKKRGRQGEE